MAKRRGPTLMQRARRVPSEAKAAAHQFGTGRTPQRAFVGTTAPELETLVRRLQSRLDSRTR